MKLRYWRVLIVVVVNLFTLSANAQVPSLSGSVKYENGTPVSYVTVLAKHTESGRERHMYTDEMGQFEFCGVPGGEYKVDVISLEVQHKIFYVHLTDGYKPSTLTVEPSSINFSEIVVNGKSINREIETKGFAVTVIEPQKVAIQSIQANELLDRTAGVRIRQDGGLGSRVNYNINGLSGDAVKIFIDGVPASNFGSTFSLNSIPTTLIERIEVYKGVVPGNLSEDALGGAINIVLKQQAKNSLATSYSFGSFNTHQWSINGSYIAKKGFTFNASAFYNYSDNNYKVWGPTISFKDYTGKVEPNQKARRFHDAYESYGTKINSGFTNVKWADRALIGAVLSKDYKEIQHGITMNNVYGDRYTKRSSMVLTLAYEKRNLLLRGLSLKLDANYSNTKRQIVDTVGVMYDWSGKPILYPDGTPVKYTSGAEIGDAKTLAIDRDRGVVTRLNLGYAIDDKHKFYVNYLFNNFVRKAADELQPLGLQKLKNTRDLQKNILSFTYESILFAGKLRTNLFYKHYFQTVTSNEPYREDDLPGVPNYKIEKIRKSINYSGYGLTLSFALLPELYLLGSAEKTIRLPNANELFGNVADNLLPPSAQLDPEMSYNANIGASFGPYTINAHSFKISSSFYYRDTRGMIRESIRTGSFVYSQFENLENVLTKGVDAEFVYNYADRVNFSFNISKFNVLFNTKYDKNGDPYNYYRMQIRNEPSFKFSGNISYFHNDLFWKKSITSIYCNINYVNGFLRNWANVGGKNLDRIPTQYPVDMGFTYTFPSRKIAFSFDAKNIFNQQVFDNFGLQKPGRAFYAKITYFII